MLNLKDSVSSAAMPVNELCNVRDLIMQAALQWPSRTAIHDGETTLTYEDLTEVTANTVAVARRYGLQSGDRVGLTIDHSANSIAIFLSLIAAGLTAVVLPTKPATALRQDVLELQLSLLVVAEHAPSITALELPVVEPLEFYRKVEHAAPFDIPETAYLVLTSGSTGRPKAVAVSQTNVVHYAKALIKRLAMQQDDVIRFAHITTLAADLGHTAIFPTVLAGGSICVAPDCIARDPVSFWIWAEQNNVNFVKTTPSHFKALMQGYSDSRVMIDTVILGGENLSVGLARDILKLGHAKRLVNHYGPSEATIGVCCNVIRTLTELANLQDTVPIGTALGQNHLSLENISHRSDGSEVGELVIRGPSVSLGYFKRPDLTSDCFEMGNNNSPIAFRTGDLCTKTLAGQLKFLGRKDRRIKVRGYIVNPPDVEVAIEEVQGVGRAAILVYDYNGFVRIDCAITFEPEAKNFNHAIIELRQTLRQRLPDWMLPSRIYPMTKLPLTENGKLDYSSIGRLVRKQSYINDQTPLHRRPSDQSIGNPANQISDIWAELLGLASLGLDENVIDAGADSLMLMQSIVRLRTKGWKTNLIEIYKHPSPAALAHYLQSKPQDLNDAQNTYSKTKQDILSPMQNWFFKLKLDVPDHFNQAILLRSKRSVDPVVLSKAIFLLGERHPLLSQIFQNGCLGSVQSDTILAGLSISPLPDDLVGIQQSITAVSQELNQSVNMTRGTLFKAHLFKSTNDEQDRILIIVHHLAIDGVSWRILLDELGATYDAYASGKNWIQDTPASFWDWTAKLSAEAERQEQTAPLLKKQLLFSKHDTKDTRVESLILSLSTRETEILLEAIEKNTSALEALLLQGFVDGVSIVSSSPEVVIDIEQHGRDESLQDIELYYGTIGWFTSLKQAAFPAGNQDTFIARIDSLQNMLNEDLLDPLANEQDLAELCFNFLGIFFSSSTLTNHNWEAAVEELGPTRCKAIDQVYAGRLTARVANDRLTIDFVHDPARISNLQADQIVSTLRRRMQEILPLSKGSLQNGAIGDFTRVYSSTSGMILLSRVDVPRILNETELSVAMVTGATGFLGLQMVHEMLCQNSYQPVCLVRGESDAEARNRFLHSYERSFGQKAASIAAERVRVVRGDVRSPGLGLPSSLNKKVSVVFHAAADTKLIGHTASLEQTNEHGTRNVVEWISQQGGIPLHYVSTLAVAGEVSKSTGFAETDFDICQRFLSPYEKSKFNAERIVRDTASTRRATYIYRTGHVASNSVSGAFQFNMGDNRIYQMIKSYVLSGLIIDQMNYSISFSHIDVVVATILAIARDPFVPAQVFHIENPYFLEPRQMARWLTDLGYPVVLGSAKEYLNALSNQVAKQDEVLAASALEWSERPNRNIIFDNKLTLDIMEKLGIHFSKPNRQWFDKTINFAIEANYMPKPVRKEV